MGEQDYRDPEWWDNRRPSTREYKEASHVPGRKSIRMAVFHSTEKLGTIVLQADEATLELTLAIEAKR